jgi:thiamine biosynthesis lipoprotein
MRKPAPAGPITSLSREAMATLFEIQFPESGVRRAVALKVFDEVDAIERQLTVYRDDSEISIINARAHEGPMEVEPRLFDLFVQCQRLWGETGGAFDVTAGPLIRAWGFHRRQGRVPSIEELESLRPKVGMQHVKLDPRARTILFDREGIEINLGGIGKGYAIDRAIEHLAPQGLTAALMGAGQSSIRAVGDAPGNMGWPIDLADPFLPARRLGQVQLIDAGLSTSASSEQYFEHEGKKYGHLLDPRTLWPAPPDRQVTVVAPTAAYAEALSTAFYVMGYEWTKEYVAKEGSVGVVYVEKEGSSAVVRVHSLGSIHWRSSSVGG